MVEQIGKIRRDAGEGPSWVEKMAGAEAVEEPAVVPADEDQAGPSNTADQGLEPIDAELNKQNQGLMVLFAGPQSPAQQLSHISEAELKGLLYKLEA